MTQAFWTFKDVGFALLLLLPSLFMGAIVARFIPVSKLLQELIAQMVMYLVWFILLRVFFKVNYQRPLMDTLGWHNTGWLFPCVIAGVALAFGIGWLGTSLEAPIIEPPYKALLTDRRSLLPFALAGVIFGPIAEELAFRGFLMPLFARFMPGALAAVVTAIPFALLHGPGYQWSWQHLFMVFLAGCAFGLVRYQLDSTLASSTMHSAYNLTFLAGYIANG
jgi:membrane protease YdiL (CAAX protease family)